MEDDGGAAVGGGSGARASGRREIAHGTLTS